MSRGLTFEPHRYQNHHSYNGNLDKWKQKNISPLFKLMVSPISYEEAVCETLAAAKPMTSHSSKVCRSVHLTSTHVRMRTTAIVHECTISLEQLMFSLGGIVLGECNLRIQQLKINLLLRTREVPLCSKLNLSSCVQVIWVWFSVLLNHQPSNTLFVLPFQGHYCIPLVNNDFTFRDFFLCNIQRKVLPGLIFCAKCVFFSKIKMSANCGFQP